MFDMNHMLKVKEIPTLLCQQVTVISIIQIFNHKFVIRKINSLLILIRYKWTKTTKENQEFVSSLF